VVILLVLAAACLVGMFFDQTLTLQEHQAQWADALWKHWLFTRLELNDVFHSWWFGVNILALALNLTACSIERLPKIWIDIQNPQRHLSDKQLRGIKHKYRAKIRDRSKALAVAEKIFPKALFSEERDGTTYIFHEKHRYARTGVYIVHIALLAIMFGSMATTNFGLDGMMMIMEERTGRFVRARGPGGLPYYHDLGFEVRCDDFRLKTFVDGAPMDFESDLAVMLPDATSPLLTKTIQVNDPLEYGGYTFYQASYNPIPGEQQVRLQVGPHGGERLTYSVAIGERVTMPDGVAFVPVEVIPNYGGLGPAVRVQKVQPDGRTGSFVVFRHFPDFDPQVRRGAYDLLFTGFDQQYATGIQVGRVPFIPVVFVGFFFLFVGMYMAFFMSHRRYWVRLAPAGGDDLDLVVAGAARRHQYSFEEEFSKMREVLVEAFGEGVKKPQPRRRRKTGPEESEKSAPSAEEKSEKSGGERADADAGETSGKNEEPESSESDGRED
jgi:cytochrome c biogenesis protein